jgi:hypothetical protein
MKLAVVEPHGVVRRTLSFVQDEFVVQAKLAFWCAGEIGPHEDLAVDIRTEDGACARSARLEGLGWNSGEGSEGGRTFCAHQEVNIFYYVDKGFIFLVFYVTPSPALSSGHLGCEL